MKNKVIITAIIISIILVVWYLYPKHYNKTFDGVFYQLGNEEVLESVSMHVNGEIRNHLSGKQTLEGTVEFLGEGIPEVPKDREELKIYYESGSAGTILSHFLITEAGTVKPDGYSFGRFHTNKDLTQFSIEVFAREESNDQGSWTGTDGLMITFPAETREEALEITDQLVEEYKRNGDTFVKAK